MRFFGVLLLSAFSIMAQAKSIEINKPVAYEALASTKEYSVLEIKGKDIAFVDVDDSYCELNAARSVSLKKVVFRPLIKKPFLMYVSDTKGKTYPIKIIPSKKEEPGLITIRDRDEEKLKAYMKSNSYLQKEVSEETISLGESRKKTITDLMQAMMNKQVPKNADFRAYNQKILLWNEADIVKEAQYQIGVISGEVFHLKNISKKKMVLDEKEFYSIADNVASVAIRNLTLLPNESTNVFVVRINK